MHPCMHKYAHTCASLSSVLRIIWAVEILAVNGALSAWHHQAIGTVIISDHPNLMDFAGFLHVAMGQY